MIRQRFQSVCGRWHDSIFSRKIWESWNHKQVRDAFYKRPRGGTRKLEITRPSRRNFPDLSRRLTRRMSLYVTFPSSPTPHRVSPPTLHGKTNSLLSWNINATTLINYWFSRTHPRIENGKCFALLITSFIKHWIAFNYELYFFGICVLFCIRFSPLMNTGEEGKGNMNDS